MVRSVFSWWLRKTLRFVALTCWEVGKRNNNITSHRLPKNGVVLFHFSWWKMNYHLPWVSNPKCVKKSPIQKSEKSKSQVGGQSTATAARADSVVQLKRPTWRRVYHSGMASNPVGFLSCQPSYWPLWSPPKSCGVSNEGRSFSKSMKVLFWDSCSENGS